MTILVITVIFKIIVVFTDDYSIILIQHIGMAPIKSIAVNKI